MIARSRSLRISLGASAAAALAALALAPGARAADSVAGTRSEHLVEKSHRVELRLDRGHAELVVRRTVFNGGPRHDQAMFFLEVPQGSVATGLATLGVKDGQPFWFRGELMGAEAAAARYRELTGMGGYYPKDPALLSWRSQGRLALQVFPCAPGQPKTVEYTLKLPTTYSDGKHRLTLPLMGTQEVAPTVVVTPARAGDRLFIDGRPAPAGASFRHIQQGIEIALAPAPSLSLDGALASVPISENKNLVALRIDAPARLSELPRRARVVVVVDASRSLAEAEGKAGLAAVRATLAHLDDALVEVITFDREVHQRHGRFVTAAAAIADLEKLTLPRRNGSRVDDALARADALLAAQPAGLPRRILAVTDLRTRSALTPARLGTLLKSGAIVHVGLPVPNDPQLSRDDEHPWAAPVRATGGLVWHASASPEAGARAEMKRIYEEWARPVRIEKLGVRAPGLEVEGLGFPEELREGVGIEHRGMNAAQVPEVEVTGELWARPVGKVYRPDEAQGRLWSALVFGSEMLHQLSEEEMMPLAMRGGAVSPVTSYLAVEPGVRPSTEGLDWGGIGEGGGGSGSGIGLGMMGTLGHGSGIGVDRLGFLRSALGKAFQRCPAGAKTATVSLETTADEVVDVPAVQLAGVANPAVASCLEEAAWALALPGIFSDAWTHYEVRLAR